MPKKTEVKKKYLIEVDEDQLFALEKGCDTLARILCGQDSPMQDILENAWHKNVQEPQNLEYTCNEFWDMRHEVEETLMRLKTLCFNLPRNGNYGINYSEESDILIDMYHTFRYARYNSMSDEDKEKCRWSVMADSPMHCSKTCPLPIVTQIDKKK